MKKHKILKAVIPLLASFVLVGLLFTLPLGLRVPYTQKQLDNLAADPSQKPTFVGYDIKAQAFSNPKFLPVLGSSELNYFDPFHPSVFSYKYQTSYTPFLLGMPGTQSLTQYFSFAPVAKELQNKKLVFFISPQWFRPAGLSKSYFDNYITKGEIYNWLESANPKNEVSQNLAKRLLSFKTFDSDYFINGALKSIASGKPINSLDKIALNLSRVGWTEEDALFSKVDNLRTDNQSKSLTNIENLAKQLPNTLDFTQLDNQAYADGEKSESNNSFGIDNSFWTRVMAPRYKNLANDQVNENYLKSPEYTDFQYLLNLFAANHIEVQFIIQGVNGEIGDYRGLSKTMLDDFSTKIKYQLETQGFTNIVDYTDTSNEPYFFYDTVHPAGRTWVAVDESIQDFMKQPKAKLDYKIANDVFLSKEWANSTPVDY